MSISDSSPTAEFTLAGEPDMPPANQPQGQQERTVHCPLCGSANPTSNRHCEECGARLGNAPLPVAPQPMINTTAAMRSAMIAIGVLVAVLVIALMVRSFGGDDTTTSTLAPGGTTVPSTVAVPETVKAVIDSAECTAEYGTHPCVALFDGGANDWNGNIGDRTEMTITLRFDQPYDISAVGFVNLTGDRFAANARPQAVQIATNDASTPVTFPFDDQEGALPLVTYVTRSSTEMTITITAWYSSQASGEGEEIQAGFNDISIEEIEVWGTPSG